MHVLSQLNVCFLLVMHPLFIHPPTRTHTNQQATHTQTNAHHPHKPRPTHPPTHPHPQINSAMVEMYADTTARGGVLEPEGIIEIKFRQPDLVAAMHRMDPVLLSLKVWHMLVMYTHHLICAFMCVHSCLCASCVCMVAIVAYFCIQPLLYCINHHNHPLSFPRHKGPLQVHYGPAKSTSYPCIHS